MFEIGSWTYDDATTYANFTFGYGGFQGSRGDDSAAGTYFENSEAALAGEWAAGMHVRISACFPSLCSL